jgi:DNA polymerase
MTTRIAPDHPKGHRTVSSIKYLAKQVRVCVRCPDLVVCRRQAVPGAGSDFTAIFVGLAPGRFGGDITGIPFTRDRSGLILREMVERVGLKDAYITNIVKCNPKDSKGRNRPPNKKEVENCAPYLWREIEIVNPKVIVPLGIQAYRFFIDGNYKMFDISCRTFFIKGKLVFPIYHPGFVIRGSYSTQQYLSDFLCLASLLSR